MTNNKMSQQQIEGRRHESSRMRLSQRASDQSNGKWVPTPFRMGNLGLKPFKPLIALFIVILILTSFIRCEKDNALDCYTEINPGQMWIEQAGSVTTVHPAIPYEVIRCYDGNGNVYEL